MAGGWDTITDIKIGPSKAGVGREHSAVVVTALIPESAGDGGSPEGPPPGDMKGRTCGGSGGLASRPHRVEDSFIRTGPATTGTEQCTNAGCKYVIDVLTEATTHDQFAAWPHPLLVASVADVPALLTGGEGSIDAGEQPLLLVAKSKVGEYREQKPGYR